MRPKSFILHLPKSKSHSGHPVSSCRRLFPYSQEVSEFETDDLWVGVNGKYELEQFQFMDDDMLIWMFNEESNEVLQRVMKSISEFGLSNLTRIRTDGVALIIEGNRLRLYNGILGVTPLYFAASEDHILIATEAKAFSEQELIPVRLTSIEEFQLQPYFKPSGHCLLDPVIKLDSGRYIEIDLLTKELTTHPGHIWPEKHEAEPLANEVERLYNLLQSKVENCSRDNIAGIPLSGGFDSGAIAAIASKHFDLHTYTMGTENINEFDSARTMAEFISSSHHEIILKSDELIPAILQGIYLNELADPVYAEGYSGLYFVFREACKQVKTLITGYGADLTLSNFLRGDLANMHNESEALIRRTSWTGELTNYAPQHFNLNVRQPFLDPDVIDMIQMLPVDYKVRNGVEKYIEKEMIIQHHLMPESLLNLKKKALHTGAGIDQLFNEVLGIRKDEDYAIKSKFLFYTWKEIIFNGVNVDNVDVDKLVYQSKNKS